MKKYEGDKKDEEEDLGLIDKLVYSQWTNDVSCNRQKVFFFPRESADENKSFKWKGTTTESCFSPPVFDRREKGCMTINYSNQVNNLFILGTDLRSPFPHTTNVGID